ncbi:hypothetical protein D3C85_1466350 [compost metagenome]
MINNKFLLRKFRNQFGCIFQMFWKNQNVVREIVFCQFRNSILKTFLQHKINIRLCLNDMPESFQFLIFTVFP